MTEELRIANDHIGINKRAIRHSEVLSSAGNAMSVKAVIPVFLSLVSIACLDRDCRAEIQEIPLHEITSKVPDTVSFAYRMPLPLKQVSIIFSRDAEGSLTGGEVRFGTRKAVRLPRSLLACLPHPAVEVTAFLYTAVDRSDPKWAENWWSSVSFPFGHDDEAPSDTDPRAGAKIYFYPQIEFQFSGSKLERVLLSRAPKDIRKIVPGITECPRQDIEWVMTAK